MFQRSSTVTSVPGRATPAAASGLLRSGSNNTRAVVPVQSRPVGFIPDLGIPQNPPPPPKPAVPTFPKAPTPEITDDLKK